MASAAVPRITEFMAEAALEEGTTTETAVVVERASKLGGGGGGKAEAAPPLKERDANKKREKATGSAQVVNAESAVAVAAAGGEGDQKRKVPMPENFVAMILALKREPWPTSEYLDSLSPEKRSEELKSAERRSKLDDDLEKLQKDVRDGIDKDGYYLVDESYLAESAACEAQIDELWAKIDWDLYNFGDWDYDDPECVVYL
uniref:Uncharacterized protein n=1 Tax=Oryza meridionalis TaxID=40149 RepID=A0A0E0DXI4_9ORYZ